MKNKCVVFVLLLISSLLLACQYSATKSVSVPKSKILISDVGINKSSNDDRTYSVITLPNKLQVALVSDPSLENAAASMAVGVGSAQDPASQPGLAHYLEHMLFLGTQKYPEPDGFFKFVQANAGFSNAFTAYEKTNYHFQINADKLDEALNRFSDYFKSPSLDPVYADKERNAVNSEWSMNNNQDNWILQRLVGVTANPLNPRSGFNIGNVDSLSDKKNSLLQDELKAFYERYYSANNMRLALIGKQSIAELQKLAERHFSDIENKNISTPKITTAGITPAQMGKSIHYQSIKDLKKLYIDFPIKNNKDQWRTKPNEYVHNLISSEEPGTLAEQLRKAGLINNLTAFANPDEYGLDGYFRINIDLTDAGLKQKDSIIASVFAYVEMIKKEGINELYFRELKAMNEKDFIGASKVDPFKLVVGLAINQFEYPIENLLDAGYRYDHFDSNAITQLLQQFDSKKARIWHINQKEKVDSSIAYFKGKYAMRDITEAEQLRWSELGKNMRFSLPPANNLFTNKSADIVASEYLKPHLVLSRAGVEAFLTQPEFYPEDKGYIALEINVDFARNSAKNIVLSNILSDIYKNQNTALIDRALRASLNIVLQPSDTNSQLIIVTGYTTKHGDLMQHLLSSYANLSISEKDFTEAVARYKQAKINAKKAPPYKQAFVYVKKILNHATWMDADLLAVANKLTLKDLVEYQQQSKHNPLLRIFAFGNYSEQHIKHMADMATTVLPSTRLPVERKLASYITPANGKTTILNEAVAQADSALVDVYLGDQASDDQQAQFVVLNSVFHNSLFNQLRTHEQLGYVVGSAPFPVHHYPGFGIYIQSDNTDLVAIKARIDKFKIDFLEQLKALNPAAIEQFKKAEKASVLQKPSDFYAEATRYENDFWDANYQFNSRERYLESLEKVEKASLIELYQKMLLDKKSMNVLVQLKGTRFAATPYATP